MKIPLDQICVRTGVLCPRCQSLISNGSIDKFEVNIMRILLDLENTVDFKFLKDASYVKTYSTDSMYILIIKVASLDVHPRILGRLGKVLSDRLGARVKVINVRSLDIREIAQQLIFPARIMGVNTLWLPDGSIEYIVRIPRRDSRYLPSDTYKLEQLLSTITGKNVKIRTER